MYSTTTEAESIEKPTESLLAYLIRLRNPAERQSHPYRAVALKRGYNTGSAIFRGMRTPYSISIRSLGHGGREDPRTMCAYDSRIADLGEIMPPYVVQPSAA